MRHMVLMGALSLVMTWSPSAISQVPNLELHYTFDNAQNLAEDASGNDRLAVVDDLGLDWLMDSGRGGGGVVEFQGSTNGFIAADIPMLPTDNFTIAVWAYRDPALAGGGGGGNDGLFQVQVDADSPIGDPAAKIIGGWVQKTDSAVWGRLHQEDLTRVNLPNTVFFMEDELWTHFAYRGDGSTFQVLVNGEEIGPSVEYDGTVAAHSEIVVGRQGTETWGGRLDDFRVYSRALTNAEILQVMSGDDAGVPGDFNSNGSLDAADIDILTMQVIAATNMVEFDLNNDNLVTQEDRRVWVEELKNTYFGDANLDNQFDSGDFVLVFTAGLYEDATPMNATWATGDWNGDREFDSGDFVAAFQAGGYEKGPRPAVNAVPEPTGALLSMIAVLPVGIGLRRWHGSREALSQRRNGSGAA
jgi:hypothetical protein